VQLPPAQDLSQADPVREHEPPEQVTLQFEPGAHVWLHESPEQFRVHFAPA